MNPDTQPPVKSEDETQSKICEVLGVFPEELEYELPVNISLKVVAKLEQLIKQEAERHADAVIGEDIVFDDKTISHEPTKIRNNEKARMRHRNHYPLKEVI